MSASNYDILGVSPDATSDQIRAAWRSSIEDLDPSDRRFAFFNEAASVLLDAEKRAAYDAELAAEPSSVAEPSSAGESSSAAEPESDAGPAAVPASEADPAPESEDRPAPERERKADADTDGQSSRSAAPNWLALTLAVATLVVAGVAAWLHFTKTDHEAVETAMAQARTAAEANVAKLFTYDHADPEKYHNQAMQVITGDLKAEYDEVWRTMIEPNLEATKGSATSEVLATALIRGSEDAKRVEVLVVLTSTAGNANVSVPVTLPITVTMVHEDGVWLIEKSDLWEPDGSGAPVPEPSATSPSGSPTS